MVRNLLRPSEERHLRFRSAQNFVHRRAIAVNEIQVGRRGPAFEHEPDELLEHDGNFRIRFYQRLVPHEKRAHELQHGNLQGKVERRDDGNRSVRPSQPVRRLAEMVSGNGKSSRQKTYVVACEVFQKLSRHYDLSESLSVGFRRHALNESREEFLHGRFAHLLRQLRADFTVLQVAFRRLEWIMQPALRARRQRSRDFGNLAFGVRLRRDDDDVVLRHRVHHAFSRLPR
mmetsp:Transcript_4417/g.16875  ORF Transcript_4417/g.16875 Transcript_4417/m.16875 type:complete len:230 (-) Transcript_4417:247-936(-)